MAQRPATLLHGTLNVLILKALSPGKCHGYRIARWIEASTGDVLEIEEGSLCPALYRMEKRGWIEAEWGKSEFNRKAKFYQLTEDGEGQLELETQRWVAFSSAVTSVLLLA